MTSIIYNEQCILSIMVLEEQTQVVLDFSLSLTILVAVEDRPANMESIVTFKDSFEISDLKNQRLAHYSASNWTVTYLVM